jgi:hypothetical protein
MSRRVLNRAALNIVMSGQNCLRALAARQSRAGKIAYAADW